MAAKLAKVDALASAPSPYSSLNYLEHDSPEEEEKEVGHVDQNALMVVVEQLLAQSAVQDDDA